TFVQQFSDITSACQMNTRLHCIRQRGVSRLRPATPQYKRCVTRRKAVIVNAVRTGVISLEEVCRRYELSVEEFLSWQRAIDAHGVPGLRVTRLQIYRDNPPSRLAKPRC